MREVNEVGFGLEMRLEGEEQWKISDLLKNDAVWFTLYEKGRRTMHEEWLWWDQQLERRLAVSHVGWSGCLDDPVVCLLRACLISSFPSVSLFVCLNSTLSFNLHLEFSSLPPLLPLRPLFPNCITSVLLLPARTRDMCSPLGPDWQVYVSPRLASFCREAYMQEKENHSRD